MVSSVPCDGSHRLALHYRDTVAPRATSVVARLRRVGACCCDCELFLNGYELAGSRQSVAHDEIPDDEPYDDDPHDDDLYVDDPEENEPGDGDPSGFGVLPPCQGVRRGSVQPCGNWVRIRRW